MRINTKVVLLCLWMFVSVSGDYIQGVVVLNEKTFPDALNAYPNMVVYFEKKDCSHCRQFQLTYSTLAEEYYQSHTGSSQASSQIPRVQFAKIDYNDQTKRLFQQYGVEDVPEVRVFAKGNILPYTLDSLSYDDQVVESYLQFIFRVFTPLPKTTSKERITDSILISCSSPFVDLLNQMRRQETNMYFYCSESIKSRTMLMMAGYSYELRQKLPSETEGAYLSQALQTISDQVNRLKYIYIYQWSVDYVREIHLNHKSMFVLITNNQTVSNASYAAYYEIRKLWSTDSKYRHYPHIRFTSADLATNLQETTEVRREVSGTLISDRKNYSYPSLGFFHYNKKDDRVARYLFPIDEKLTYQNLLVWMNNIMETVILEKPYDVGKQPHDFNFPIEEWFLHDPDQNQPDLNINFKQIDNYMISMDFKRFQIAMTSEMKFPFLIYVMWKNYQISLNIFNFLRKMWGDQQRIEPKIPFYYVVRNVDELPPYKELQVQYLPALIYVSESKHVKTLEGVTDQGRLKQFIEECAGKFQYKKAKTTQIAATEPPAAESKL